MGVVVGKKRRQKTTTTIKLPDLQGTLPEKSTATCCCAKATEKHTTTSVPLSKDLLIHELAMKILAGANQKGRGELLLGSEKLRKQQLCLCGFQSVMSFAKKDRRRGVGTE